MPSSRDAIYQSGVIFLSNDASVYLYQVPRVTEIESQLKVDSLEEG